MSYQNFLSVMTVTTLNVATLKTVKNAVIGNRTAKGNYGRDEAFVSRCVECILYIWRELDECAGL